MATTTNYGWTTPDDTALVKDGAAAIRTLGSSIDTSLNTALGTKKAGLVLLNTTSFSGVASQSINNVFVSTYTNYRVVMQLTGTSGSSAEMRMRLRVSGTDLTTTYNSANKTMAFGTGTTTFDVATGPTDRWNLGYVSNAGDGRFSGAFDIYNPFTSLTKTITGFSTGTNTGAYRMFSISGGDNSTLSSYTGFTIYPTAGNLTGSISVYGYNE
jgi:hypothetical protein